MRTSSIYLLKILILVFVLVFIDLQMFRSAAYPPLALEIWVSTSAIDSPMWWSWFLSRQILWSLQYLYHFVGWVLRILCLSSLSWFCLIYLKANLFSFFFCKPIGLSFYRLQNRNLPVFSDIIQLISVFDSFSHNPISADCEEKGREQTSLFHSCFQFELICKVFPQLVLALKSLNRFLMIKMSLHGIP